MTIALCDDNLSFAQLLRARIERLLAYCAPDKLDISLAPAFSCAEEVLEYLKDGVIDILFLDIDMPKTNGFELAKTLQDIYPDTTVIFVSAYDDFVYTSFEFCPFAFLRKGHLDKELDRTLKRVIEKWTLGNKSLLFDTTNGERSFRVKDILFFEGEKNYFCIKTIHDKEYRVRGTMKSLESLTQSLDFFRIHSAYIVSLEHIEKISSDGYLVMKNGKILSISRKRFVEFKRAYMEWTRRRV